MILLNLSTFNGHRPPMRGHEGLLTCLWTGVDVAAVDGAPVEYFVSAGALLGRFVHACGLASGALNEPGYSARGRHHLPAGNAGRNGESEQNEHSAHAPIGSTAFRVLQGSQLSRGLW